MVACKELTMNMFCLSLMFCLLYNVAMSENMTFVQVEQGLLRGSEETLPSGGNYYSFKGIPYAKPPVGKLRFKAPEPSLPWDGIRDATKHGSPCPQIPEPLIGIVDADISEDCLYLNVYTRNADIQSKTPVMLWIHGGGFRFGSGDADVYGSNYLLAKDVVLVTINYRLEAFGFLCLDNADVPGNAGMKDQVAAMKWVKDNIQNFGGDPENITIFGESAGAASVALHLVSPLSRGLFSKAIVQSGSNIADWSHSTNGRETAFEVAKYLGKETDDEKELLTFLQQIPASDLVDISRKFFQKDPLLRLVFLPVIEKHFHGNTAYLDKQPIEYLTTGEVADVPVIIGVTSGEGIVFFQDDIRKTDLLNKQPDLGVFRELKKDHALGDIIELSDHIKKFYIGHKNISEDTVSELVELQSDYMFIYPAYRLCSLLAKHNSNPVYLYYFSFVDDDILINKVLKGQYIDQLPLASHGTELPLLFSGRLADPPEDSNSPRAKTSKNLLIMWTNFAKNGIPTPDATLGVKWDRYNPEQKNYLQIDTVLSTGKNFLAERMLLWESLYKKDGLPY